MAKPEHVEIVKQGKEAVENWQRLQRQGVNRALTMGLGLDLKGHDFADSDLSGFRFEGADFSEAKFPGAVLTGSHFISCNFTNASFHRARAQGTPEQRTTFSECTLDGADFSNSIIIYLHLQRCQPKELKCKRGILSHAYFEQCTLISARFEETGLNESKFEVVVYHQGSLVDTGLYGAVLNGLELRETDVSGADFREARITECSWFHVEGLHAARGLERAILNQDPKYLEGAIVPFPERWCDWERLRRFGKMPLFGLSYSVLILIPTYIYFLAFYNHQVDRLSGLKGPTGEWVGQHLHKLPMPSLSLLLLGSTVLLAIASTIYTLWCPTRVTEFTKDVWCDQLQRPLLHYWPFAWKYRWLRLICGACYLLGGCGALYVLITKVFKAGVFIVENSAL
jgi:uncharacterized protein YjbI with pentapeptide repeats